MKKFTRTLVILTLVLFQVSGYAQEIMEVDPGVGTLNQAIEENGGNKIYQLQAGGWYQIDDIIEHSGYHLQIIGSEPSDGGMPATLQTSADAESSVFPHMFNANGDITLENIYFVNADLTGEFGNTFFVQNDSASVTTINNCIIDPAGKSGVINLMAPRIKFYFTNNLTLRHGVKLSPNDGQIFSVGDDEKYGVDTLLVENNTFVCTGTGVFYGGFDRYEEYPHNFIKFNHNTFVFHKSQVDWSLYENEYYWTNNLMFDFNTQPYNWDWMPMPGGTQDKPLPALIYADSVQGESFPSERIQFVQYNMHYRNPDFYELRDDLNQTAADNDKSPVYFMDLVWAEDSSYMSREATLFNQEETFPYWKYGNTTKDLDPQWVDDKIYEYSDKFVEWTEPATLIHALGFASDNYPPASEWADYFWDLDGDPSINDTWPVFNGKYTNEDLMTASIAGLPMGDLNWFPSAKEAWVENKDDIDAHMKATNEDQMDIGWTPGQGTGVKKSNAMKINTEVYPNPFSSNTTLSLTLDKRANVELAFYDVKGQIVKTFMLKNLEKGKNEIKWNGTTENGNNLNSGLYFYHLSIDGQFINSGKVMKID